ncbi:hypothetical protein EG68_01159, partial [Paragonimus skrjabini miyazakii]
DSFYRKLIVTRVRFQLSHSDISWLLLLLSTELGHRKPSPILWTVFRVFVSNGHIAQFNFLNNCKYSRTSKNKEIFEKWGYNLL